MERSRAVLVFALLGVSGVWFSRISGEEVEMRVRRGDNITLYSDCVWKTGFKTLWFRGSSPERPPTILAEDSVFMNHPRYSFAWNSTNQAHDLLLKNVSEPDLGLYYCALQRIRPSKMKHGNKSNKSNKGNRTIRLCINDSIVPCTDDSKTTSTPPVSDCSVCWKLLVSVCPVCVLLITICVYCIYRYRTTGHILPTTRSEGGADQPGKTPRMGKSNEVGEEDVVEVCYASLDLQSRGHDHLKKNQKRKAVESSDFSTYSEVNLEECRSSEENKHKKNSFYVF